MSIYTERGYIDRNDYLTCLAEENDVDEMMVFEMADLLGEGEDFDGLKSMIEDIGL